MSEPDPRFPNRPTHPDFDLLSEVALTNDALSDLGPERMAEHLASCIDPESLRYLALNRAGTALTVAGIRPTTAWVHFVAASIIDGFVMGVKLTELRAERGEPPRS